MAIGHSQPLGTAQPGAPTDVLALIPWALGQVMQETGGESSPGFGCRWMSACRV
jgi:hypothetical protein